MTNLVFNSGLWFYFLCNLVLSSTHLFELGPCLLDLSEPCSSQAIVFYLYSSGKPTKPVVLETMNPMVPDYFNLTWPTKVIIHGYGGSLEFNSTAEIRREYLKASNTNVIVVDWGRLATLPCYPAAVVNTWQAGQCTATLLMTLQSSYTGFDASNVHAIGFSLGAHIASYASNFLRDITGKRFSRITGLDPALPFFATIKSDWKLDSGDADFVDVIHTNVGVFGKIEAIGDIDFYVNGGSQQPGCKNHRNEHLCSHMLAPAYFAESINSQDGFWALECSSYLLYFLGWCFDQNNRIRRIMMGEHCLPGQKGVYFVSTNDSPPYALG